MRKLWQKSFGTQHGHHRALLFTRTKADADRLAGILGYMSYHSEAGTVEDKARIIEAWVSGKSDPFLVGASGLGKVQYCTVLALKVCSYRNDIPEACQYLRQDQVHGPFAPALLRLYLFMASNLTKEHLAGDGRPVFSSSTSSGRCLFCLSTFMLTGNVVSNCMWTEPERDQRQINFVFSQPQHDNLQRLSLL